MESTAARTRTRTSVGGVAGSPAPGRPLALIFAPPPPPPGGVPGGIASITAVLMRELAGRSEIRFMAPVRKEEGRGLGIWRGIRNLWRLARGTWGVRRGANVLIFSSAGPSFWEKCAWSVLVRVLGR